MKSFTFHLVLLGVLISTACLSAEKPNVLFIAIDDLRPSLGCYGAPDVRTPHLDALASQGILLNRAYAQVATCGASRASLFSGLSPTKQRFTHYRARIDQDAPHTVTLPQVFKQNGYTTVSIGKVLHDPEDSSDVSWSIPPIRNLKGPRQFGKGALLPDTVGMSANGNEYSVFEQADVDDFSYGDGLYLKKAIEELNRLKDSDQPFFLACGFKKPHLPFYAPKKYWDLYDRSKLTLPANLTWQEDLPLMGWHITKANESRGGFHAGELDAWSEDYYRLLHHGYYACVSYIDTLVGYLLEELDRLHLAEDTIVVLWGDHGFQLGERSLTGKHNTLDLSLRVPIILHIPGSTVSVVKTDALIESIDLFPTLCDLAGLEKPKHLQGVSFSKIAADPEAEFRDSVYSRFQRGDTVFTQRFAYTRFDEGSEMLFDYQTDPNETRNVVNHPAYADDLVQIRDLLNERIDQAKQFDENPRPP